MTPASDPHLPTRAIALGELARPGNVAMAIVGAAIGATVAAGDPFTTPVGLAAAATALVAAGGNALNDVTDAQIDARAHPERPIPSGRLSARAAMAFAAVTFALALAAGWLAAASVFLVVLAAEAVLLGYEAWLKASGLAGNLVVAGLVAATFVAGALATGRVTAPVAFLAGLALLANVGREAYKDIEDAAHDTGRRTIARRWGPQRARRFAQATTLTAVALSRLPLVVGFGGWPYSVAVLAADVVFVAAVLAAAPARSQRLSKVAMVLALVAFGLGGVL